MLNFIAAVVCFPAKPITLYVSPVGSDRWSGRLVRPNARRTDGPLASIAGARDRLRVVAKGTPAVVQVGPGTYRIEQPIVFTPEDSGGPGGERIYQGSPN